MEMGTGKTLVAIQEILCYEPNMTLILCPKSVIEVWAEQFQTHAPDAGYMIVPLTETTSAKKADRLEFVRMLTLTSKKPLVIVVNYESAIRGELKKQLLGIKWDHLILDEAHKIKAAGGKASRFCTKLQLNEFGRKRLLSGTMLPNNKLDAYGQFRFLEPGMYGTNFTKFRNLFAEMGGYQGYQIVGWKNEERFNKILNSITFHVDKSVLDLPPTLTLYRPVEISPTGRDLLRNIEKEFIADVGAGTVTAANALSRLVKMREVTSGFVRDDDEVDHHVHDGRLDALEEVLEEIGPDKKVVVFCEFRWDLDQVMSAANRLGRKYGEVSGRFNDTVEARYPPDVQILGIHPKSGGLGLNLQDSHYCIFYSVGFSLGDYEQALSRVERGGQTESVRAIHLVAKGTVDEQVYAALRDKKKVVLEIMDYVKRGGKF
jgi:SNF2 family DNA or RNA helicase